MTRMMRGELEQLHERFDQMENTCIKNSHKLFHKYVGGREFQLEMKLMITTGMIMTWRRMNVFPMWVWENLGVRWEVEELGMGIEKIGIGIEEIGMERRLIII